MTKPVAERRAKYSKAWATARTSWPARASSRSSPNSTFVVIRSVCAPAEMITPLCDARYDARRDSMRRTDSRL